MNTLNRSRRGIIKGAALAATGIALGPGISASTQSAIAQAPAEPRP
ncbi:MAG: twin-arginine translocation signal domain-containing protein [Cyanobacteria bacterium J06626_18]